MREKMRAVWRTSHAARDIETDQTRRVCWAALCNAQSQPFDVSQLDVAREEEQGGRLTWLSSPCRNSTSGSMCCADAAYRSSSARPSSSSCAPQLRLLRSPLVEALESVPASSLVTSKCRDRKASSPRFHISTEGLHDRCRTGLSRGPRAARGGGPGGSRSARRRGWRSPRPAASPPPAPPWPAAPPPAPPRAAPPGAAEVAAAAMAAVVGAPAATAGAAVH